MKRDHSSPPGARRPARTGSGTSFGLLLPVAAVGALSLGSILAGDGAGRVDDTRTALEQLVETRRIISREKHDWQLGRELLKDRIDLLGSEIETLRGKIAEEKKLISEADEKKAELAAENDGLEQAAAALADVVQGLESRTQRLLARVPDPIRERVKPLSQRIPDDPAASKLSLSERFANVVGILNDLNRFNREITVTSEVRTLPDGNQAEVTALYVGLGHSYYVNANGTAAGIGTAGPEGWTWRPAPETAAAIEKAIAILNNEQGADFVQLPIEVD